MARSGSNRVLLIRTLGCLVILACLIAATLPPTNGPATALAAPAIDSNAYYKIVARHSGKLLDVDGRSTADGANVIQWSDTGGTNQQWRFVDAGGGYYKIVARHSGKLLDVNAHSTADGANVIQWSDAGSTNQQWSLVRISSDPPTTAGRQMEQLNRGVVRVAGSNGNFISWRLLGTDPSDIGFHVYRGSTRLTASPITGATNYFDSGGSASSTYTIRPVIDGQEQAASEPSLNVGGSHLSVPLQVPAGGTTPDGVSYTYSPGDASVGDLDGDGAYEIVLKWDPSNAKDNSQSGYTGNVYLDAYEFSGTRLWRIDLGRNIRAGAHYTQFIVYDLDGDGRAELASKTADGTRDGTGQVIGSASADYRNSSGYILSGPEYLTIFDGGTGRALATTSYTPPRGDVCAWGDCYGNRVDRFLAAVAYLDGQRPSLIMARGYYTRSVLAAWDWRDGQLTQRWVFDTDDGWSSYAGQGNHNLSVADVDADGRDEIVYGAMAVDDNGQGLWTTGYGHGDALHVSDMNPDRPGLEVFDIQERVDDAGVHFDDAKTGATLWKKASSSSASEGPGRGVAADVYAGSRGYEMWATGGGLSGTLWNVSGGTVGRAPSSANFLIWWDGDPVRELLDGNHIDKYGLNSDSRLVTANGASSINGTKATPVLSADLFGDWREEVIWRANDNRSLHIYTTAIMTSVRIYTLMHDPQYRVSIAWQNVGYNQPPHTSFYLGDGMASPPSPNIYLR